MSNAMVGDILVNHLPEQVIQASVVFELEYQVPVVEGDSMIILYINWSCGTNLAIINYLTIGQLMSLSFLLSR